MGQIISNSSTAKSVKVSFVVIVSSTSISVTYGLSVLVHFLLNWVHYAVEF